MKKGLTGGQQAKISAAKFFLKNHKANDTLYNVVIILGPALFGSFFNSNTDTVWSRVEDPPQFRLLEMMALTNVFEITMERLIEILILQVQHNEFELLNNRPIGREKYQNPSS
jgi:hypothetical protein